MTPTTVVVYGTAKRDRNEQVCMFFRSMEHAHEWFEDTDGKESILPGRYRFMTLVGIDYDDFEVGDIGRFQ